MGLDKLAPELIEMAKGTPDGAAALEQAISQYGPFGLDRNRNPRIPVILKCDGRSEIPDVSGAVVFGDRGKNRTALASAEGLRSLSEEQSILRIKSPRIFHPLNDVAGTKTALNAFRANRPGLSGKGVIIGVVDTGIDSTLNWFSDRILAIWDHSMEGRGWRKDDDDYGKVLRGGAMGASSDIRGHGTHVAGIAAGTHGTYSGVAPGSNIIAVKTNFSENSIMDAIEFIFYEADQRGMPAVINLSLGGHDDPHDGTDALSERIMDYSGPGRIVVAAAGNDGERDVHGEITIPPFGVGVLKLQVWPGSSLNLLLACWYDGQTELEVSVKGPSGSSSRFLGPSRVKPAAVESTVLDGSAVKIEAGPRSDDNGDHEVRIEIQGGPLKPSVAEGVWEVSFRNAQNATVIVQAWSHRNRGAKSAAFLPPHNVNRMKIGSPGCAPHAITVGSYTTRHEWMDFGGTRQQCSHPVDALTPFSSPGPNRDGGLKPDLAAPGAMVVSALSSDHIADPAYIIGPDAVVKSGTSMAAPYVSGLVALLLERDSSLNPAQAKALLRQNCSIPFQPNSGHDLRWGFGLINAAAL
ncbi:S8 family serine peptidase [Variovorax sp. J2P1-59]|uniref:S8 family serine peptidase n=1 Tax=Variovorax flavidus TaxID=3053501 RepID=UPI002576E55A|nr:S8 family serine peptidase [Variovorax sp. J2P1-59]MDM0075739.1 S8 family serine peptidase [Variovorax sp. J2P1-59]